MLGIFRKKQPQLIDRDGERYDVSLRVLSRDLPDFRGVTLDLSRSGVQLETGGLLEVGMEPVLKFEFDRGELETFESRARVIWSRKNETSRSKFHSGLIFVPETDDQKRQLVRMATVLQARSETDLKTLLDQARRIDPELERSYANISTNQAYRPASLNSPTRPAAVANDLPSPPTAKKQSPPPQQAVPPHPGWYMPLNLSLEGYTWNRVDNVLHIGLREGEVVHGLYFPHCQLFQVLEPAADSPIAGMYSTMTSPATRKLEMAIKRPYRLKHYRFVGAEGVGLFDIVSSGCLSQFPKES